MTKQQITALEKRFWKYIRKVPGSRPTKCYEWTGAKTARGYGHLNVKGKTRLASHVYFFLEQGSWPPLKKGSYQLNHMCRNCGCVRHCYLGTPKQNMQDRERDGTVNRGDRNGSRTHPERRPRGDQHWSRTYPERIARGDHNGSAKLTEANVHEIFRLRKKGWIQQRIADRFGVSQRAIRWVLSGKTWAWRGSEEKS